MNKFAARHPEVDLPTLWELKVFLAVARSESITQAADELLYLSPSSVLYYIKSLERRYAIKLFFRGKKRMELTQYGRILYSTAEEVFRKLGEFETAVAERPESAVRISLGAPVISSVLMRSVYGWLCVQRPSYEVRFANYWESKEVESALLREEIDAGVLYQPPTRHGQHLGLTLLRERVFIIARASLYPGNLTSITTEELSRQILLVPRTNADHSIIFAQIMKQLGVLGVQFSQVEDAPNVPVVKRLMETGGRVTLLPASMAREFFRDERFRFLCLQGADLYVDLTLAYSPDDADSPMIESAVRAFRSVLEAK